MRELEAKLRSLDELQAPDLWPEIEARALDQGRAVPFPATAQRRWTLRYVLVAAVLAVVTAGVATQMLVRPSQASAADVIEKAQQQFAEAPPFRATVFYDLNPEGGYFSPGDVPRGATATIAISYGGPNAYRQEIVAMEPVLVGTGGPASFLVWDGERAGQYRADADEFATLSLGLGFEPLKEFSWNTPYPNWEDICRRGGSEVLPDAEIAGRVTRRVRCADWKGVFWELWIDRETGLVLKIVGELGRDDFRLGTSPRGGFEVTGLEYEPTFAPETFAVVAPAGANEIGLAVSEAKVPPFTATFRRRISEGGEWVYEDTVWYRDSRAWRREVLEDSLPDRRGLGAGGFAVWDGSQMGVYNARQNSFSRTPDTNEVLSPVYDLSPTLEQTYSRADCELVAREEVVGRPTDHLRCMAYQGSDIWLDGETGLMLKLVAQKLGLELEVTGFEDHPIFPGDTFEFSPPSGARDAIELANDPYAQTALVQGDTASPWTGPLVGGGTLGLGDLRGKPVLILFFADWCPAGDPACDVLPQFGQVFEGRKREANLVWVNFQGSAIAAKQIIRKGGYTFPVVDDSSGSIGKAWGVQGIPTWVLLDADGRVVEVRLKPQTFQQLEELLAKA